MKETICKKVLDEKLAIEIADMLRTELPLKNEIHEDEKTYYNRLVEASQGEIIISIFKRTEQKRIIEKRWRRDEERWDTHCSCSYPAKIDSKNNKAMVYNSKYYDVLKKYFRKREKENKEKWEIVRCFQERKNE